MWRALCHTIFTLYLILTHVYMYVCVYCVCGCRYELFLNCLLLEFSFYRRVSGVVCIKARTFVLILYCHWEIWIRNYQPLNKMVKTKSNNSQKPGKWNELIQLVSKPPLTLADKKKIPIVNNSKTAHTCNLFNGW
jgi:hypothetical protein